LTTATLFPYTTLFRSDRERRSIGGRHHLELSLDQRRGHTAEGGGEDHAHGGPEALGAPVPAPALRRGGQRLPQGPAHGAEVGGIGLAARRLQLRGQPRRRRLPERPGVRGRATPARTTTG